MYRFGNGKYKQFEGIEIVAENCVKARVKDLAVEGKTYQNLIDYYNWSVVNNKYGSLCYYKLVKPSTIYTAIVHNPSNEYNLRIYWNETIFTYKSLVVPPNSTLISTNTSKADAPTNGLLFKNSANMEAGIKFEAVLLESDYTTNTDLPESIDGIESVAERENNILSVEVNEDITPLNLPIPLRSLPNGTCDTIEGDKLVQRVGKVTFDGSEDWKSGYTTAGNLVFYLINTNFKELSSMICDTYIVGNTLKDKSIYCGNSWRPQIRDDSCTTVEEFKQLLSENPVTIYYELAEPITHSLEIPQLATVKGTNIISTENNIKPKITMKVKVKK